VPLPAGIVTTYGRLVAAAGALVHPVYPLAKLVRWYRNPGWSLKGVKSGKGIAFDGGRTALDTRRELAEVARRRRAAWIRPLEQAALARRLLLTARSDVVVGLSSASPIELGLALHHVYGVPILPGSGLKGLARASRDGAPSSVYGAPDQAGRVAILDGWPCEGWLVQPDIMTPHAPAWYGKDPGARPDDGDNPIPIPFLSVAAGSSFEVALVAQPGASALTDLGAVTEDLRRGLDERGFGAKTAAGYGVFAVDVVGPERPPEEAQQEVHAEHPRQEGEALAGQDVPVPRMSAAARALTDRLRTLRSREVRPELSRIQRDFASCGADEQGEVADRLEARLRELGWGERDIRDVMNRVRKSGPASV
jgi:CRISPR/Cas system CMR subunit Cmr6 (Cas7 group RAMP superfamily)